jgi:uncharacterized membrane protein HdeD (DUF308 family)
MSSMVELPKWLRVFNISAGFITIIIAVLSLIFINEDLQTLMIILAIALIIIGIFRTLNGILQQYLEWYVRVLKISVGILVLPIAIAVLALSNIIPERIVSLLAIALILSSLSRITLGTTTEDYPIWFKITTILIGIITIVAAGIVLLFQGVAESTVVALLAVTFIFSGAGWIYAGIKNIEEP